MIKFTPILFRNVKFPVPDAIKLVRQAPTLPVHLHEIMIGLLLGDAGVYRTTKSITSNSRLEFSLGRDRVQFMTWLYGLFKDYVQTPFTSINVNTIKDGPKAHKSYRFKTLSLPVFNYYRDLFYQLDVTTGKYTKRVPENIEELITPRAMAAFVMGDGNFQSDVNTIRIYTNGFKHDDVIRLAKGITQEYNIYVGVRHDRNDQYILAIGAKDSDRFKAIVLPHMEKSMLYRIGL